MLLVYRELFCVFLVFVVVVFVCVLGWDYGAAEDACVFSMGVGGGVLSTASGALDVGRHLDA
jgi:hypothetical protein